MAIQIPGAVNVPALDFTPLAQIGNTFANARRKQMIADTVAGATGPDGKLDVEGAATKLAGAGLLEEARPMLALAQQKAALAQQAAFHRDTVNFQNSSLAQTAAHQAATLAETRRQHDITENRPIPVQPGVALVDRQGNVVREPDMTSRFDPQTVTDLAQQLRKGDTSVLTNIGRGAQGSIDIKAIRTEAARLNREEGLGGADQATTNAGYRAGSAGLRTLANRNANVEYAANTANRAIDIADAAIEKLPRTQYLPVNRLIQAWQSNTGSPEQAAAGAAVNTLVNEYARVVSPTGVPTEGTRQHGRDMLNSAQSHEQFKAVTAMMRKEIQSAKAAGHDTQQELRDNLTGKKSDAAAPAPAAAPLPKVKTQDEANEVIRQAKEGLRAGKPRDAIIKRMEELGVPGKYLGN